METKKNNPALASFVLLTLLLLVPWGEGRLCEFPSSSFKGFCFSDRNCANVCQAEHYGGGHCEGLRHRCLCQKPC